MKRKAEGPGLVKGSPENDRVAKRISSCPVVERNFNPRMNTRACVRAHTRPRVDEQCLLWQFRLVLSLRLAACSGHRNYETFAMLRANTRATILFHGEMFR